MTTETMTTEAERADLLARLEARTSARYRDGYADAPIEMVREAVARLEKAAADTRRLGHLGAVWKSDEAYFAKRVRHKG